MLGPPHGLIGQSFGSPGVVRNGRTDMYPQVPEGQTGEFTTTAMAEGAIEGSAAMYEVASRHETHFPFSRFDIARVSTANKVAAARLTGTVDASSVERLATPAAANQPVAVPTASASPTKAGEPENSGVWLERRADRAPRSILAGRLGQGSFALLP